MLEGTAARLAARHASPEEIEILRDLVADHVLEVQRDRGRRAGHAVDGG
ncbi:MAG: hypothetical protein P8X52_04590 [Limibacillus sp.]